MKTPFEKKFQEKKLIAVLHLSLSLIWLPSGHHWPLSWGQPQSPNNDHCIIINFCHKGHREHFNASLLWNHSHGQKPNLKSSKDLAKNCINSTQHFLITQRQKKRHLIRNNARFKQ